MGYFVENDQGQWNAYHTYIYYGYVVINWNKWLSWFWQSLQTKIVLGK